MPGHDDEVRPEIAGTRRGPPTGRSQTTSPTTRRVLRLAIVSRVLTLVLMVLHDAVFQDLSTSDHLQQYPCGWSDGVSGTFRKHVAVGEQTSRLDQPDAYGGFGDDLGHEKDLRGVHPYLEALESGMASLTPWDSVYFVRIAQCGYESDQIFAFFPLLPFVMWVGGKMARGMYALWVLGGHVVGKGQWADELRALAILVRSTSVTITTVERIGMVCMGLIVNFGAFCVAAVVMYRLGVCVLGDHRVAYLSAVLFCFNPASVFYSAVYTESLFGMCTWLGMWMVFTGRFWGGVGWLTLAGLARSNGILGAWFLIWMELLGSKKLVCDVSERLTATWRRVIRAFVGAAVVCLPYICMQAYGWFVFCRPVHTTDYIDTGEPTAFDTFQHGENAPSWCNDTMPSIYGYIQHTYWDVGFLNFYQKLIRVPFVVQSVPIIVLSIATCWTWTFGPWELAGRPGRVASLKRLLTLGSIELDPGVSKLVEAKLRHSAVIIGPLVAPFVYHLALMSFAAIFVMHVNVATRFLSSSPLIFWGAAQWILNDPRLHVDHNKRAWRWRIMLVWCASYLAIGTLMFPNFLPWV